MDDENPMEPTRKQPELIDHIGWDLWRATDSWVRRFTQAMVDRGYFWFGEARGGLIQHIGPGGVPQTALAARAGMTKQAVQQHLDDLVKDSVVERIPDPLDARRKWVQFTADGILAFETANEIKRAIEADYQRLMGKAAFDGMKRSLALIIADTDRS